MVKWWLKCDWLTRKEKVSTDALNRSANSKRTINTNRNWVNIEKKTYFFCVCLNWINFNRWNLRFFCSACVFFGQLSCTLAISIKVSETLGYKRLVCQREDIGKYIYSPKFVKIKKWQTVPINVVDDDYDLSSNQTIKTDHQSESTHTASEQTAPSVNFWLGCSMVEYINKPAVCGWQLQFNRGDHRWLFNLFSIPSAVTDYWLLTSNPLVDLIAIILNLGM